MPFWPGTLILMADGRQVPIEVIARGDRVIDAHGAPAAVLSAVERIASDVVSAKHRGSYERTLLTADQWVMTDGCDFLPIHNLAVAHPGAYLSFPRGVRYDTPASARIDLASILPADKWFRLKAGRIYRTRRAIERGLPVSVAQGPELAYMAGLYVAEGSATTQGLVCWSLHHNEAALAEEMKQIAGSVFDLEVAIDLHPERRACVARLNSKTLAEVLWATCGKGSHSKRAPWDLIGPFHAEFLRGLFLGDAHFDDKNKKVVLSMAAPRAIRDAQSMLWGLGVFPTLQRTLRPDGRSSTSLVFAGESRARFFEKVMRTDVAVGGEPTFGDERFVFRKLQEVVPVEGDYVVHAIVVDGSRTCIANGFAVRAT